MSAANTRAGLRDLAVLVLRSAGTLAKLSVLPVSVVPTASGAMPILYVQCPSERKLSMGRAGTPKFTTVANLFVVGRVTNASADRVQADLDALIDQVHASVLGSYDLQQVVQQFASVETHAVVTGEAARPIGEFSAQFECELFQRYEPARGEPLLEIDLTLTHSGQVFAEADVLLPQS